MSDEIRGGIIRLKGGSPDADLLAYVMRNAEPHTNAGRMSARVVISAEGIDRDSEWVVPKGLDLTDHRKNPIVMFNHRRDLPPVGLAQDPLKKYTLTIDKGGRLVGETFFDQGSQFGVDCFRLVESGVMRGASVTFLTVPGGTETIQKGGHSITKYNRGRVIEYSHLPVPSHQDCLVEAVYKGLNGRPLCAPILDALRPFCPERKETVVGGWDGEIAKEFKESDHPRDQGKFTHAGAARSTKKANEASVKAHKSSMEHRRSEEDSGYALRHAHNARTDSDNKHMASARKSHSEAAKEHRRIADKERDLGYHEVANAHEEAAKHHEHAHRYRDDLANKSFHGDDSQNNESFQTEVIKMFNDTASGATGDVDPFADPMADDQNPEQSHEETVKESLKAIVDSLVDSAMDGDESNKTDALKKIKHLFDTHSKLIDSGDDGEIPDLDDEGDVEDLDDNDEEDDDEDDPKSKSLAWKPEDGETMTAVYKFLTAVRHHPNPSKAKLEQHAATLMVRMEKIAPVEVVAKSIKAKKPLVEITPDIEAAILASVQKKTGVLEPLGNRLTGLEHLLSGVL